VIFPCSIRIVPLSSGAPLTGMIRAFVNATLLGGGAAQLATETAARTPAAASA